MILQGTLNPHNSLLVDYARTTLAPQLIDTNSVAKMLYWRDYPHEPQLYPVCIGVDHTGITRVHPGQTRVLSAILLKQPRLAQLTTHTHDFPDVILDAHTILELDSAPKTNTDFWLKVNDLYAREAHKLAKTFKKKTAFKQYQELYSI